MRCRNMLCRVTLVGALVMVPAAGLLGCDSTNGGQGGEDQAAVSAIDDSEAFAESAAGLWKLSGADGDGLGVRGTGQVESEGLITTFEVKEGGTGKVTVYYQGELNSSGDFTWEATSATQASMTLNSKTSQIELSNGSLVTTAEEDGSQMVWTPVSQEELDADLAEAKEAANGTPVSLGETVSDANYEFTLTSAALEQEIYPSDTSGYYAYYEDEAGSSYYVVRGTFKNLASTYVDIKYGTSATLVINDRYEFVAQVEGTGPGDANFMMHQPDPLDTVDVIIFASISDEVAANISSARLEWNFTDDLSAYYTDSRCTATYAVALQ